MRSPAWTRSARHPPRPDTAGTVRCRGSCRGRPNAPLRPRSGPRQRRRTRSTDRGSPRQFKITNGGWIGSDIGFELRCSDLAAILPRSCCGPLILFRRSARRTGTGGSSHTLGTARCTYQRSAGSRPGTAQCGPHSVHTYRAACISGVIHRRSGRNRQDVGTGRDNTHSRPGAYTAAPARSAAHTPARTGRECTLAAPDANSHRYRPCGSGATGSAETRGYGDCRRGGICGPCAEPVRRELTPSDQRGHSPDHCGRRRPIRSPGPPFAVIESCASPVRDRVNPAHNPLVGRRVCRCPAAPGRRADRARRHRGRHSCTRFRGRG